MRAGRPIGPLPTPLHCPLTSGPLGLHTCPVFLGGHGQLGLGGQRSGQGQQPCGTAAHQPGGARGEGHRGCVVGQWLELLLLETGRVGQGRAHNGHRVWQRGAPESPGPGPLQLAQLQPLPGQASGGGDGGLTPIRLFSSPTVTCLARSTAWSTCCWCWEAGRREGVSGEPPTT